MSEPFEEHAMDLGIRALSEFVAMVEKQSPFYFEDSQVVLQVENKKYKIHRYFLVRESDFFEDLFSLPQPQDTTGVEGSDDEHPIILPETTIVEFENLLRFFYFGMHDNYKESLTDWIATLSISTRFIFDRVRQRAIKEITLRLGEIEPFELIRLAIKYDVEKWLKPAYSRIVTRHGLITHAEAHRVSFPMAVMLMRSREKYWQNPGPGHNKTFGPPSTSPSPDSIIDSEVRLMEQVSTESQNVPSAVTTRARLYGAQLRSSRMARGGQLGDDD